MNDGGGGGGGDDDDDDDDKRTYARIGDSDSEVKALIEAREEEKKNREKSRFTRPLSLILQLLVWQRMLLARKIAGHYWRSMALRFLVEQGVEPRQKITNIHSRRSNLYDGCGVAVCAARDENEQSTERRKRQTSGYCTQGLINRVPAYLCDDSWPELVIRSLLYVRQNPATTTTGQHRRYCLNRDVGQLNFESIFQLGGG